MQVRQWVICAGRLHSRQPIGKGTRDAAAFGNTCPQTTVAGEFSAPSVTEDCLHLNVFVPSKSEPANALPVMFWIPGGGLFAGAARDYDPTSLVEKGDVIVVTVNYRIGLLGFFADPEIEEAGHALANYGLLDQQFALQWVRRNIAAFGGDPGNVTRCSGSLRAR